MAERDTVQVERGVDRVERQFYASQWQLMWLRFRRHKVAIVSAGILFVMYFTALFAPFFGPHDPVQRSLEYREAPPQRIHFFSDEGFHLRPFVYPLVSALDRATYKRTFVEDRSRPTPIRFFVRGFEYTLLGITSDLHFYGTGVEDVPVHIFGADSLGRDVLTRVLYGARISLSVGLVGVTISFFLGILFGGIAGYFGGLVDEVVQRTIEILTSIPRLPLWMGLSAALPLGWPVVRMYFAITVILSLLSWPALARTVRGRFLSLREEDFVIAARLSGMGHLGIIFRHMLPSFMSHIIASLTLAIPGMILGETSLSFLGLGMQAPAISWGVLLRAAQKVQVLALAPWLMIPGIFVIVAVLAFNFLGDGLRDAADPYGR